MAATSKSRLDRMVAANQNKQKAPRKPVKQYLPPEATLRAPVVASEYPDEDVEFAPETLPTTQPDDMPADEGYEPLDSATGVGDGDGASTETVSEVDVVAKEGAVSAKSVEATADPRFLRPRNAPISPSRPVSMGQDTRDARDDGASIPGLVTLAIPAPIRARYAAAKGRADQPLREYIVERLTRCADHESESAIYINDATRREIERVANRNFSSGEELLGWLLTTSQIHLGNVPLTVDQELIDRALFRKDPDQSDAQCLSEMLTAGIEIRTGLR